MSELCSSCEKKFGLFRKRHTCDLCKKEFCGACISNTPLSWGGYKEPRYELVFEKGGVGYRPLSAYGLTKVYALCTACKNHVNEKIRVFTAEARKQYASIVLTENDHVPGYAIVKRCGFLEYRPDKHMPALSHGYSAPPVLHTNTPMAPVPDARAFDHLRLQAVKRGANALINVRVTYHNKFVPPPPPPTSRRTPLDFVPGYVESRWREQCRPTYKKIPVYEAEAVVIEKETDRKQRRERP